MKPVDQKRVIKHKNTTFYVILCIISTNYSMSSYINIIILYYELYYIMNRSRNYRVRGTGSSQWMRNARSETIAASSAPLRAIILLPKPLAPEARNTR